jgi:hypothetical protein
MLFIVVANNTDENYVTPFDGDVSLENFFRMFVI